MPLGIIDDSQTLTNIENTVNDIDDGVSEINGKLHNYEKWFGAAKVANLELHVADSASDIFYARCLKANNEVKIAVDVK